MLGLLLRLTFSAAAVWLSTVVITGIDITAETTQGTIGTVFVVALMVGIVNAILKPVIKLLGCAVYVVTLGLVALLVNGLLFWLASWIAGEIGLPFHVDGFLPAVLGALLVGVVSWLSGLITPDNDD